MKTQHTPGPWHTESVSRNAASLTDKVLTASDGLICDVSAWWVDTESAHANARLIAAAPDMLEALETLVKWMDDSGLSHTKAGGVSPFTYGPVEYSVVREARAAIAKARGNQ